MSSVTLLRFQWRITLTSHTTHLKVQNTSLSSRFCQKMNNFLVCYIKKTYICSETILEGKPMSSSVEMKQYPVADKVEYIIALVSEFGKAHSLTDSQAWRYIKRYGGVKLMDEHYGFMHTQSFSDMVADMTTYLNRQGGKLV